MTRETRLKIFEKAATCRHFENKVFDLIKQKVFKFPIYLSAGQEYIPATLSELLKNINPLIFAQHRAHSTYIAFNGNIKALIDELLGRESGCAKGMGGSASIQEPEINMFGHDGFVGSQIPISVGACHATKKFTLSIMGDGAAEEDYVLAAIGYAATKTLPILFIVEDNNLSVLTEKKVRRSWNIVNVAKGFGLEAYEINDSPIEIETAYNKIIKLPALLNINTCRLYWHAGAGIDDIFETWDRYKLEKKELGAYTFIIDNKVKNEINTLWEQQLKIQ